MKIQDVNNDGQSIRQITQGAKPLQPEKNVPGGVSSPDAGGDRVELSPESRDIKKIQEILAATPEVRTEKVTALKKAVEEGTYQVKAEDIADKMVQEMALESHR